MGARSSIVIGYLINVALCQTKLSKKKENLKYSHQNHYDSDPRYFVEWIELNENNHWHS